MRAAEEALKAAKAASKGTQFILSLYLLNLPAPTNKLLFNFLS